MKSKKIFVLNVFFVFSICYAFAQSPQLDFGRPLNSSILKNNELYLSKKKVRFYQDSMDNRGVMFGINMGTFKGSDYNATYFSGARSNANNINYIVSNPYRYYEIKNVIGRDFDSVNIRPPESMSYDFAMMIGFYLRYNFKRNLGVFVQINYAKLNTTGQFALAIDSATFTSEPALRFYPIIGIEQRTYIDFGFQKQIAFGDLVNFYYEGGLSISSTSVQKSEIQIGNLKYSLVNTLMNQQYTPNTQQQEYNVYQGGVGFGFFGGAGVSIIASNAVSIDPGLEIYYAQTGLDGYSQFRLNYYFYVRLMMRNFL